MPVRAVDDKPSDTLVVVSGEGSWTGSSTLPHLHHTFERTAAMAPGSRRPWTRSVFQRQPSSGATYFRMLSIAWALYSTPS